MRKLTKVKTHKHTHTHLSEISKFNKKRTCTDSCQSQYQLFLMLLFYRKKIQSDILKFTKVRTHTYTQQLEKHACAYDICQINRNLRSKTLIK